MSDTEIGLHLHESDLAPGDEPAYGREIAEGIRGYLIGLGLATLITAVASSSPVRRWSGSPAFRLH